MWHCWRCEVVRTLLFISWGAIRSPKLRPYCSGPCCHMFEVHISFSRPNGIFTFFTAPLATVEIEATLEEKNRSQTSSAWQPVILPPHNALRPPRKSPAVEVTLGGTWGRMPQSTSDLSQAASNHHPPATLCVIDHVHDHTHIFPIVFHFETSVFPIVLPFRNFRPDYLVGLGEFLGNSYCNLSECL